MNKLVLMTIASPMVCINTASAFDQNNQKDGAENKPNVVLIYADDIGYGDFSCYGATAISTPNVDKLASEGIRFTNAYSTAATSTPSRFSMLTGKYAFRQEGTYVADGDAAIIIPPDTYTLADVFQDAGYHTAAIGKWHLGLGAKEGEQDWNGTISPALVDLGFDYSYIMAATADRVPCVFIEDGKISNYDPEHPVEISYKKPFEGEPLGSTHPELLILQPSHGHNRAIVNGISRIGYMKGGGTALWEDENIADSITSRAVNYIHDKKNEPFFLYFATNDIHVPRYPHSRFRGKSGMGLRGDAMLQFDWSVGEIIKALEEAGVADNTLIILSSDNGPVVDDGYEDQSMEQLGDHKPGGNLRGAKYSAYEAGTRVPTIVKWTNGANNLGESDILMSQVDWLKSLAELVGVEIPENAGPDSYDRLGNMIGKDSKGRPWVLEESGTLPTLAVRTDKWKYIEAKDYPKMVTWGPIIETGTLPEPQLFDMEIIGEEKNIAKENPKVVTKMNSLIEEIKAGEIKKLKKQ